MRAVDAGLPGGFGGVAVGDPVGVVVSDAGPPGGVGGGGIDEELAPGSAEGGVEVRGGGDAGGLFVGPVGHVGGADSGAVSVLGDGFRGPVVLFGQREGGIDGGLVAGLVDGGTLGDRIEAARAGEAVALGGGESLGVALPARALVLLERVLGGFDVGRVREGRLGQSQLAVVPGFLDVAFVVLFRQAIEVVLLDRLRVGLGNN